MLKTSIYIAINVPIALIIFLLLLRTPVYAYLEPPIRVALVTGVSKAAVSCDGGIELREESNGVLLDKIKGSAKVEFKLKGDSIKSSVGHKKEVFWLRPEFDGPLEN